jgi:hypothetical protein
MFKSTPYSEQQEENLRHNCTLNDTWWYFRASLHVLQLCYTVML